MSTATTRAGLTFELCPTCGNWTKRYVDGCDEPCHPSNPKGEE